LDDLARSQAVDGAWGADVDFGLEVTGTALLAFLEIGVTTWAPEDCRLPLDRGSSAINLPAGRDGHRILRRGIDYILRQQGADGFIGSRGASRSLRNHALAATVLSEAYGLGRLSVLRYAAEQAMHALEMEPFPTMREDADAVGWIVLALRSATLSGLPFDRAVYDRLSPNLRSPTGGAIELLLWTHLGRVGPLPPDLRRLSSLPDFPSDTVRDRFWGTKALLSFDGPEGSLWRRWRKRAESSSLFLLPEEGMEAKALRALTSATRTESWIYGAK
jgi:hypothetical protein